MPTFKLSLEQTVLRCRDRNETPRPSILMPRIQAGCPPCEQFGPFAVVTLPEGSLLKPFLTQRLADIAKNKAKRSLGQIQGKVGEMPMTRGFQGATAAAQMVPRLSLWSREDQLSDSRPLPACTKLLATESGASRLKPCRLMPIPTPLSDVPISEGSHLLALGSDAGSSHAEA